jgi:hypothetical protein
MAAQARLHVLEYLEYHARPRPFADRIIRMGFGWEEAPAGITFA